MVSNGSNTLPVLFGDPKASHGRSGDCLVDPGWAHVYKWDPEQNPGRFWFCQKSLAPSPLHPVEPEYRVLSWQLLALSGSLSLQFGFTALGPYWGKGLAGPC